MYIYQVNPDGVTVASRTWDRSEPIPDGWFELPYELKSKFPLFLDGGVITDKKPKALADKEKEEAENEKKIRKEMRKLAIDKLKEEGALPPDYEDTDPLG